MSTIWVLTREINEYLEEGEYFVAAWLTKPSHQQLNAVDVPYNIMNHVESGGGRIAGEYEWFYLREIEEGETRVPREEQNR